MERKPFNRDQLAFAAIEGAFYGCLSATIVRDKHKMLMAAACGLGMAAENLVVQRYTMKRDVVSTGVGGFVAAATFEGLRDRCIKTALTAGAVVGPFYSLLYAGYKYYGVSKERSEYD